MSYDFFQALAAVKAMAPETSAAAGKPDTPQEPKSLRNPSGAAAKPNDVPKD